MSDFEDFSALIAQLAAAERKLDRLARRPLEDRPITFSGQDAAADRLSALARSVDLEAALRQLQTTARGRRVLPDLLRFLRRGGTGLDASQMEAVLTLLAVAWGGRIGELLAPRPPADPQEEG